MDKYKFLKFLSVENVGFPSRCHNVNEKPRGADGVDSLRIESRLP